MYIRRRSPIARIVSLAILIAALAVAGIKIKDAGNSGKQAQSEADRLSSLAEGGRGSSYLILKNLESAIAGVRARIGAHAPMLEVSIGPTAVEFQYLTGDRAAGFTANTVQPALKPETVTIVGGGSPRSQAFSLALVNATVPSRLVGAIRRMPGLSDFTLANATLRKQPFDGHVEWSIAGTGGGRALNFLAEPAGAKLRRVG